MLGTKGEIWSGVEPGHPTKNKNNKQEYSAMNININVPATLTIGKLKISTSGGVQITTK